MWVGLGWIIFNPVEKSPQPNPTQPMHTPRIKELFYWSKPYRVYKIDKMNETNGDKIINSVFVMESI